MTADRATLQDVTLFADIRDEGFRQIGRHVTDIGLLKMMPYNKEETTADWPVAPGLDAHTVIRAFSAACTGAGRVISAQLWAEDSALGALRLLACMGGSRLSAEPQPITGQLGQAATSNTATLDRLEPNSPMSDVWLYCVPLNIDEHRAVACVHIRSTARPDGTLLARAAAIHRGSLSGAVALQIARTETRLADCLITASRELSRALDPDSVLQTTIDRAVALCDAGTASIMLLDPETRRLAIVRSFGLSADVVHDASLSAGEGIAGWVLASGQPLLIEDLASHSINGRRHGVRSAVSVPIADEDGVLGVLNVGSRDYPSRLTHSHLDVMETLGMQAAVALRNARATMQSRELYFDTLRALCLALETKDPFAHGSTEKVTTLCTSMSDELGLEPASREALRIAALVHDIGMASVGQGILCDDRPLSTVERALVRLHPSVAAEMLREVPALERVAPIVYHHHEWFDGTGYVGGIAGEQIPLESRILAVADAYVAMTSPRPYSQPMSRIEAIAELRRNAGTQFDPAVVEAMTTILRREPNRVPEEHIV